MNDYKTTLTEQQISQYNQDGFLVVQAHFDQEQVEKLYRFATQNEAIGKHAYGLLDKDGKASKLALWFTPGNDPFGLLARSESLVGAVDQLLEGAAEVGHYHSKLMQKEPRVGGAWEWHQDYGYWYRAQFPYPNQMISVMTALTEANIDNGCLQVIKGSHLMGRINHHHEGSQMGADMDYVNQALGSLEHVFVALQPGDILFFHSNILHRSEANLSDKPRWSFISAYNRISNVPLLEPSTSCIHPIDIVPDSALLEKVWSSFDDSLDFLSKEKDVNIK